MALGGSSGGRASSGAIKAGEAFFQVNGDDKGIREVLSKNISRVKQFASTIRNIGIASAGIGASILAPMTAVFSSSLNRASDAQKLATRLGSTTESVTALGYAAEAAGVQQEDFVKAAEKMQDAALKAAKGGTDQAASLQLLGTNAQDFARMKMEDKFLLVASSLEKMTNPLEQSMLLSGLFGDEFGKLLPLFKQGKGGIQALLAEASKVGSVINSDDAKSALEINKELHKAWTSAKNVLYEVGLAVLGFNGEIKEGTAYLLDMLKSIREFIRENRQLILTIFLVAAGVTAGGIALAAFGLAINGIIAGIGGLIAIGTTLLGIVFSPLVLKIVAVSAAVVALTYAFTEFTETGQIVKQEFLSAWNDIKNAFTSAYEGIVNALKKGDLALAGEIAMAALEVAWLAGIEFLTKQWIKFKNVVIDVWMDIKDTFDNLVLGLQIAYIAVTEGVDEAKKQGKELGKVLDDMFEEEKKDRGKFRDNQINEARGRLEEAKKRLEALNKKAAEPKEKVPERTPETEALRQKLALSLGDSVKGVFTSADFKGSLGLGKANEAAKKQYEISKQQLAVLIDINKRIEPGVFQ